MSRIAIIGGAGYVGLSYAAALAKLDHDVIGLDLDADKVSKLSQGCVPIFEPGLEDLLREGCAGGRLRFTADYADAVTDAEYVFLCVGTPPASDGAADMLHVRAAASSLATYARGHTIVVNKSTMPPGSAHLIADLLEHHRADSATFSVVAVS
ncbi:MAG: NAD(P)-binding domain-containing protein [Chloroflexota bacterium]|nr:NAD(P)-binding domain-containing protein [Chloroflexota bacterium]